jgi:alpha-beta hydrolase superfamily lysophospholipase
MVPIDGARHDVFLSNQEPRAEVYRVLDRWLHDRGLVDG